MNPNFQQQLIEINQHNQQNPDNPMFFLTNGTNENINVQITYRHNNN